MNTKEKTKLLTISLLCCGRPDTTERCLKSLIPIREAIDSEIQVVDTGCSPETRAIIEKYADEVFDAMFYTTEERSVDYINYMLDKDIIRRRLETGITYAEFSYTLIQGYDFLKLFQENCKNYLI